MLALLSPLLLFAGTAAGPQDASSPVGLYEANQMEMAAGLELLANGRFRYALTYGALDESAEGTWIRKDNTVLLTSDPVTPPRLSFLGQKPSAAGVLQVRLDVPEGLSRQYFEVAVEFASGHAAGQQMSEDGLSLPFETGDPPVKAAVILPMFDVSSDVVGIDAAKGYALRFRFEPNDLGKVDFRATPLRVEEGDLLIERHDRLIRFRKSSAP